MKLDVVDIFIVLFLGAVLLPTALDEFYGADTTDWDGTAETLYDAVPVFGMLGVAIGLIVKSGIARVKR